MDAIHRDPPDLFHLGPGDRLAIGDDCEGLQGRLAEAGRPVLHPQKGTQPGRILGFGHELPGPGDADQPVAAPGGFMFPGEFPEHFQDPAGIEALQGPDGFRSPLFGGRATEHIAEFRRRQRLLRGEQQRFEDELQVHRMTAANYANGAE